MPLIDDIDALGRVLSEIASASGIALKRDTHYDANNFELQWWHGRDFHRLDFQPLQNGELVISHLRDRFRLLPRVLRWAHQAIPSFPYLATVEHRELARVRFPFEHSAVHAAIAAARSR